MAEGQSGDDWADDGQASLRQRAGRLSARYFHDRELFLRSQDRVHYLKVTGRAQKWLAGVALGALCWVGYSTLAFFLSGYLVDAKDREITRQEVAYSALLAQASDFQAQAEQLSETEQALTLARAEQGELARRLRALEAELAARDEAHAAEVARLEGERRALAEDSAGQLGGLEAERAALQARLADLEALAATAEQREQELAAQITTLQGAVSQILGRNTQLAGERSRLQLQVASLDSLIADMRDQQKEIVDRVDHQTANSIEGLEAIIAETGLDPEALLASVEVAVGGQGGPFIPADDLLATDASYELQVSVAMLDQRLDRLEQLSRVLEALPLAVPLEHYEINSEFGYRKDPINGRSALHSGLDFGAPRNTPLYTTAPGVVTFAGWRGRYGRTVEIDHGYGVKTRFAHMSQISVKKGQTVALGDEVGLLGSSGRVTGPHLHYEVLFEGKPYDPMNFIKAGKDVF